MPQVDPATVDQIMGYQDNYRLFARDNLVVRDHETSALTPLILRRGQGILDNVVEKMLAELGYVRIIVSKARREGISTHIESRAYHETSLQYNVDAFIVAHEARSTQKLFSMTKLFHEKNPCAPATRKSNSIELVFDTPPKSKKEGLKSTIGLATAGTPESARSMGVHVLHMSEEAFWPEGERSLIALMQCLPDPPARSMAFRESTSNGFGNTFQVDAFKAYAEGRYPYYEEDGQVFAYHDPESASDWVVVFLPWFINASYTRKFKSPLEKSKLIEKAEAPVFDEEQSQWIDSEQKQLKDKHHLAWEQINWREWAIENKCRGNVDLFRQEYPATFLESFLSQGSNVFGRVLCDHLEEQCEPPAHVGEVIEMQGKSKIRLRKHGNFQRWKKYEPEEVYFMTVDVAGGDEVFAEKDKKVKEPDRTNVDVWNRRTGEQVAQWNGHREYDLVADLVEIIGGLYGRCKAVVERNNHGLTVTAFLKKADYPQYEHDDKKMGWPTTRATKPVMVDTAYKMVRDGDLQLKCKETVEEMRVFIEDKGKSGAAPGCKDDRVITLAIASQMMELLPRYMDAKERKKPAGFTNWDERKKRRR